MQVDDMLSCKCFYTSEFIFSRERSPASGLWTTNSPPESSSDPQVDLVKYNVFVKLCAKLLTPILQQCDQTFWDSFVMLPAYLTVFMPFFLFY